MQVNPIELTTTPRPVAYCGAPSSQDYNDSMSEILTDLASLSDFCNSVLVPLLAGLPEAADEVPPLNGRNLYSDPGNLDELFYTPGQGPKTVAETLVLLKSRIEAAMQSIEDLSARVTFLQSRLATSNQADMTRWIADLQAKIELLEARVGALER